MRLCLSLLTNFNRYAVGIHGFCAILLLTCGYAVAAPQVDIAAQQDAKHYLNDAQTNQTILSSEQQQSLSQDYLRQYFAPWDNTVSQTHFTLGRYRVNIRDEQQQRINFYSKKPTWGENLLPHDQTWSEQLRQQMQLTTFPSHNTPAISLRHTALRELPTALPAFFDPQQAGEGYPFDNLQIASIWAGTPLRILHLSKDGDWALVITSYMFGWVAREDIAPIAPAEQTAWQNARFVAPLQDYLPVKDEHGTYRFKTHIGSLYPLVSETTGDFMIQIPIADEKGQAKMIPAHLNKDHAAMFPVPAQLTAMADTVNQMLAEPYGWGGLNFHRDCSQTLRDYFTLYGLWLPRNSAAQLDSGRQVDLSQLSATEKAAKIRQEAIPYLTLLGRPGHVMLYIGEDEQNQLVFHNKWGLHTHDAKTGEGRALIARSAITELGLGKDIENATDLMHDVTVLTQLPMPHTE